MRQIYFVPQRFHAFPTVPGPGGCDRHNDASNGWRREHGDIYDYDSPDGETDHREYDFARRKCDLGRRDSYYARTGLCIISVLNLHFFRYALAADCYRRTIHPSNEFRYHHVLWFDTVDCFGERVVRGYQ